MTFCKQLLEGLRLGRDQVDALSDKILVAESPPQYLVSLLTEQIGDTPYLLAIYETERLLNLSPEFQASWHQFLDKIRGIPNMHLLIAVNRAPALTDPEGIDYKKQKALCGEMEVVEMTPWGLPELTRKAYSLALDSLPDVSPEELSRDLQEMFELSGGEIVVAQVLMKYRYLHPEKWQTGRFDFKRDPLKMLATYCHADLFRKASLNPPPAIQEVHAALIGLLQNKPFASETMRQQFVFSGVINEQSVFVVPILEKMLRDLYANEWGPVGAARLQQVDRGVNR